MRKRVFSLILISVIAFSLILGGCGGSQGGQQQDTKAPSGQTTTAPEKPQASEKPAAATMELKYNDFNPAGIPVTDYMIDANKKVEERTEGRLKFTNYFSASLLKYPETFKGVVDNIADFSYYTIGGTAGIHQFTEVFNLPFLGFTSYDQAIKIYKEIFEKYPEFQQENEKLGVYLINVRPMLPVQIHSVNKKILVPSDLKGEKIIAEGHYSRAAVAAGGTALNMGPTDWYNALQKGVAGHTFNHFAVMYDFKIDELTKYHTMFGPNGAGNGTVCFIANLDVWNKISPQDQQVIKEEYWGYQERMIDYDKALQEKAIAEEKSKGQEFIDLTAEQVAEWAKVTGEPTIEAWIADTEAAGYPGRKVIEDIRAMIAASK